MKRFAICFLGLALGSVVMAEETLGADQLVSFAPDTGDAIRIESAEYLRTYSQEIAAAACFLYNDIDAEFSAELLREARKGFDLRLNALLNGNEALGIIGGEQRRKTLVEIEAVQSSWAEISGSVDALLADSSNSAAVATIKAQNMPLFHKTDRLVTIVEGQYANPAVITQANVMLLELVGRQAMMTQKIAKDACKIFTGEASAEIADTLQKSVQVYDATLYALRNGMPQLGIQPAPTPEIDAALASIQNDWGKVSPIIERLVAGETIDRETQIFLFRHMVEEMVRLEDISHKYANYSLESS